MSHHFEMQQFIHNVAVKYHWNPYKDKNLLLCPIANWRWIARNSEGIYPFLILDVSIIVY